jgi:hypothetical protein
MDLPQETDTTGQRPQLAAKRTQGRRLNWVSGGIEDPAGEQRAGALGAKSSGTKTGNRTLAAATGTRQAAPEENSSGGKIVNTSGKVKRKTGSEKLAAENEPETIGFGLQNPRSRMQNKNGAELRN